MIQIILRLKIDEDLVVVHNGSNETPERHSIQVLGEHWGVGVGDGKEREVVGEYDVADVDGDGVAAKVKEWRTWVEV